VRGQSLEADLQDTAWGWFLRERVIPNYPVYRALEFDLRRRLRKLRGESRDDVRHLAVLAVLETVNDAGGLADYLQAFLSGAHWHGGRRRTWSARLRGHQRVAVRDSFEGPTDRSYVTAGEQIDAVVALRRSLPSIQPSLTFRCFRPPSVRPCRRHRPQWQKAIAAIRNRARVSGTGGGQSTLPGYVP